MASGRVTIADIAHRAGVSTSAVSYALNDRPGVSAETRRRIVAVADTMGWRPNSSARAIRSARTGAVGLVLLQSQQPHARTPDFLTAFLPGLEEELAGHDVLLALHQVPDAAAATEAYRAWQQSRRIDGAIVTNPTVADPRLPCLEELKLPAIVVGDTRRVSNLPCVWTDDSYAVRLAVDHLSSLGHRQIARVGMRSAYLHSRARGRAFDRAMRAAGLQPRFNGCTSSLASDAALVSRWLADPDPPTALIHEDALGTVHAMMTLRNRGLTIPADLSLVGWDDFPWSPAVSPTITTVRRDLYGYGRLVAAQLLRLLDGEPVSHVQGTTAELAIRESTGPAPQR